MAYNYTVPLKKTPYYVKINVILWCYQNLSYGKDFACSEETTNIHNTEVASPDWLWLNKEEDVLALRLKFTL